MNTIITKTLKYTGAGAGIGLAAGIAIGIFVAVITGFLGFLAAFGGVHQDDPNIGGLILIIAAIGAGCGFLYGLFSGVHDVRNAQSKRTDPDKEARYGVTFRASIDTLPALIKLVTDSRLSSAGAVVVNSEVQVKYQSYTYHAVIEQGTAKSFPDNMDVADIPGQNTKMVTRRSIMEGQTSLLVQDCAALVAQILPPGPSYVGADSLQEGCFSTTIELRLNAQRAQELRSKLPAQFTTVA